MSSWLMGRVATRILARSHTTATRLRCASLRRCFVTDPFARGTNPYGEEKMYDWDHMESADRERKNPARPAGTFAVPHAVLNRPPEWGSLRSPLVSRHTRLGLNVYNGPDETVRAACDGVVLHTYIAAPEGEHEMSGELCVRYVSVLPTTHRPKDGEPRDLDFLAPGTDEIVAEHLGMSAQQLVSEKKRLEELVVAVNSDAPEVVQQADHYRWQSPAEHLQYGQVNSWARAHRRQIKDEHQASHVVQKQFYAPVNSKRRARFMRSLPRLEHVVTGQVQVDQKLNQAYGVARKFTGQWAKMRAANRKNARR